ncbi:hypothetical protein DL98DRAFT_634168 [Cadophora sp. DSE1049]|nr:hypothetical protein DL98DRAFT_634168 [Cadophora sp. DSE1049]
MSSYFNFSTSWGFIITTPEIRHMDNEELAIQTLEAEVLTRVPQLCSHEFPTTPAFKRWRKFWIMKIFLLRLRSEDRDWPGIINWFAERGITTGNDALKSLWTRGSNEVLAMERAARQYQETQLLEDGTLSFEPNWDRIAMLMRDHGCTENWTPEKVKYAWHYGASALFPHISLQCIVIGGSEYVLEPPYST